MQAKYINQLAKFEHSIGIRPIAIKLCKMFKIMMKISLLITRLAFTRPRLVRVSGPERWEELPIHDLAPPKFL